MECESCGQRRGVNRVIVDGIESRLVGGFCSDCEADAFGTSLRNGRWNRASECVLCSRDAYYLLATVSVEVLAHDAGDLNAGVDATVETGGRTPALCDEHFHGVVRRGSAVADEPATRTTTS